MYLHKLKHTRTHSYPLEEGFEHVGESLALALTLADSVLWRGRQSRVSRGRLRAGGQPGAGGGGARRANGYITCPEIGDMGSRSSRHVCVG